MNKKMTLFAFAGSGAGFGASGLANELVADDAKVRRAKKPSPESSDTSAAAPKPQPLSHRNSRRVRRQKFRRLIVEDIWIAATTENIGAENAAEFTLL
jgi:hypothetical protein